MTSRDFAYWLQGYFEIAKPTSADADTLAMIQAHLALVFVHEIDPSHGGPEEQAKLNAIHNAPKPTLDMQAFYDQNPHLKPSQKPTPNGGLMRC